MDCVFDELGWGDGNSTSFHVTLIKHVIQGGQKTDHFENVQLLCMITQKSAQYVNIFSYLSGVRSVF